MGMALRGITVYITARDPVLCDNLRIAEQIGFILPIEKSFREASYGASVTWIF